MSESAVALREWQDNHADKAAPRTLLALPAAEAHIERDLHEIREAVEATLRDRLRALLLVGGYARGEGSVIGGPGGAGAYNDYDLVAVVRGSGFRRSMLSGLAHTLTGKLGVEVELSALHERSLERLPRTLFWLDVSLGGFEILAGDKGIQGALRGLRPRDIPLEECGRLLANRAVGLALSNLESVDCDHRKARHAHKAVLACGDSLLLAADWYRPTLAGRLEVVRSLSEAPAVGSWFTAAYAEAVAFRRQPDAWQPPGGDLNAWYEDTCRQVGVRHLRFEVWRVGMPAIPREVASWRGRVYPQLPDVRRGGRAWSALRAAAAGDAALLPYLGHSRERLARVAVALAYDHRNPATRAVAARHLGLGTREPSDSELHGSLLRLALRGG